MFKKKIINTLYIEKDYMKIFPKYFMNILKNIKENMCKFLKSFSQNLYIVLKKLLDKYEKICENLKW